jgi:5-methyltetrahydrofolate--homocysteine methyltransferase
MKTGRNTSQTIHNEYSKAREAHLSKQSDKRFKTIEEARAGKFEIDLNEAVAPKPTFLGTRAFVDFSLEELVPYIDWTPFFHTWELRGSYPRIFEDEFVGKKQKNSMMKPEFCWIRSLPKNL